MGTPASVFTIALALGPIILAPVGASARADGREEGPFEIEKCQTIDKPGSYKLVNNLVATNDCLVITADFVTIDLAGFTIKAGTLGIGKGIAAQDVMGIAVRNGSISGFSSGVDLGDDGSIVEGLRVVGGASFFTVLGIAAKGIVKGNFVAEFGGSGSVPGIGIDATGTVASNYVLNGGFAGIRIGQGSTVIGNTIMDAFSGLVVDCPSNLTDNTAVNNGTNLVLNGDGCNNTNNVAP